MKSKSSWKILKQTFAEFSEDNVLRLSAALAYYAMFSLGPLLVIAVGVAGLAFGHEAVRKQVEQQLQGMVGSGSANTLQSMMSAQKHGKSVLTTVLGIAALLFGAGGVFGQLQDALNTIWGVKTKPGKGIWVMIRARFLSFTMVLGMGFLLLISMALTTFLSAATGTLGSLLPIPEGVAHALNFVVSFAVISFLFAMMFKYLPDVKIPLRKVWVGAIGTALLFTIGKYVLALYLGRESTASAYGAAGSVIILLLWVYYASIILFFGAEFTQVYVRQTGTKVVPDKYAVPVTAQERAEQGMTSESKTPTQKRPEREPAPAYAVQSGAAPVTSGWTELQSTGARRFSTANPQRTTPALGKLVRKDPWQFFGMMLAAGFTGAFFFLRRRKS